MTRASEEEPDVASTTPTRASTSSVPPPAMVAMRARRDMPLGRGLRLDLGRRRPEGVLPLRRRLGFGGGLRARRGGLGAGRLGAAVLELDLPLAVLAAAR